MANLQLHATNNATSNGNSAPSAGMVADSYLLDRFLNDQDEPSFELLVRRHGSMVLNVCARVLRDNHAAEDAFQATFLTLLRKANSISKRESVSSWLYKVAFRAALRAKARSEKQGEHERPLEELVMEVCYRPTDDLARQELRALLDAEVNRLPEKYRTVFILCYLEGKTNEQAAEQLGCPKGTVLSRLARARERLRARMAWRGLALAPLPFARLVTPEALSSTTVSPELLLGTVRHAVAVSQGQTAAGAVPAAVVELVEGVALELSQRRWKIGTMLLTALVVALVGTAGAYAYTNMSGSPGLFRADPGSSGSGCGTTGCGQAIGTCHDP